MHPTRRHQSYLAAMAHRVSGVLLALFLPIHFLLLGSAVDGSAALDHYLRLADNPFAKFAEWGLVSLLGIHLALGLRVLLLELTAWPHRSEKLSTWILPSALFALALGLLFIYRSTS